MTKSFDYEEVFMGLTTDSSVTPQKIFDDDYRLRCLVESVHLKGGRMLDIGCGGGSLTESLRHYYPKTHIFGCDISKTAIRLARKFGSGRVKYDIMENKELPYKENFFDAVLSLDVLEHIPDVHYFLKEVKRVLKANGLFFLVVPCEGQPFTLTSIFQKIKIGDELTFKHFGHIHPEFTHKYIAKLLTEYKFIIIRERYKEHLLSQFIQLFQYFLPKESLELFLGKKKAQSYYDRSIIKKSAGNFDQKKDFIMILRTIWSYYSRLLKIISDGEIKLLNQISFSALKLLVLARNSK